MQIDEQKIKQFEKRVLQQLFQNTKNLNSKTEQMNPHKRQTVEKMIVDQSGSETLDLNDIVLGYQGARIVGALLPQYHKNIRHIRINGNNIDSEGFEFIFTGLMHCPYLKSIQAEWNNIGSSDVGLSSLSALATNLQYLQFIDLKNNRISHYLAHFIADIIEMNKKCLKVIDLRWNQLGELGAKQILAALGLNKNIKFIGLEDNRISMTTLMEIQNILKGKQEQPRLLRHSHSLPNTLDPEYFPISSNQYASMDVQLKTGELRTKIENQQKQANRYTQKIQLQIQKVLQKLKLKGTQITEMQLRHDALMAQNLKVTSELRQAERMLALQKERTLGVETRYSDQKSQMKNEKYQMNSNIQNVMQKFAHRNQRQLDEIQLVMGQKLDRLNTFLKQRLFQKRSNQDKLIQLKQDILKFKANKQDISTKQISNSQIFKMKSTFDEQTFAIKQEIANVESTINNEIKKGQYMSKELNNQILKSLNREQNLEKDIFQLQNKIKGIHHQMAMRNLELERNLVELRLKESEIFDKQATIQMENNYLKYMHSEGNVKFQVQSMIEEELSLGALKSEESIQIRIAEVQRALRAQQAQNRMIKNQYEKLMSQLENITKKNIQLVLFE